ncbi:phenylacetate--CoA ligase, partial [Acinetobacter baumannii]
MCHNCTIQANQLAQELMKRIKTMIGISVTVEVVTEATLPRSEGKAKRVIDMRQIA